MADRATGSYGSENSLVNLIQPAENAFGLDGATELEDYPEQQSESSDTQSNIPPVLSSLQRLPSVVDRLGQRIIVTNIGAVILLMSAIPVLSFLWFGGEENKSWRRIMIDGWIGQAVTLSTLAIRLAVSVQASTAVAMLASVSLESKSFGGVLLPEAPALSIARFVNTGPFGSLLLPVWRNSRWRSNRLALSVSVLAITTLVSQFTSTLLLWDVGPGVVKGFPEKIETGIGFSMDLLYNEGLTGYLKRSQNYFLAPPPSYPTFAELVSEPSNSLESVVDTGPSIRAFLPIASETDRSTLLEFEGNASAFDARVLCVRPTIRNWSISTTKKFDLFSAITPGNVSISFSGTLLPPKVSGDLVHVLRHNISSNGFDFNFTVYHSLTESNPGFTYAACHVSLAASSTI